MKKKRQLYQLKHQGIGILGLLLPGETMKISAQLGNNRHMVQALVARS